MPRAATYGALAELDDDAAIAEIASGTLSRQIAERYGVLPYAIRKRLAKHPDYPQAVKDQAHSLVEQATELAMTCSDEEVAIARVRVDAAHKWAAARDPATWAAKGVNINIGITQVTLDSALAEDAMTVIRNLATVAEKPNGAVLTTIEGKAERLDDSQDTDP